MYLLFVSSPPPHELLTTASVLGVSYWRVGHSWPIVITAALLCCGICCENGPPPRLMTGEGLSDRGTLTLSR